MAILIPSRSTRLTQPIGRAEVDPGYGITPIGLFLPASFTEDAATGEVFTRGSAAALTTSRVGRALNQTAVNTGLHRTIPGFQSVSDYTAIWHGVPVGAPSGSTPTFIGIANSNTSQSAGPLAIEYLSTTQLQVVFKSSTSASTRAGNFTWANAYGRPTTLVASYSADEDFVRLRVCVDGVVTDVVASAVSSGAPPTLTGTERLIVGPDVAEIATRHTNAHVAMAGVFYGRLRGDAVQEVLRNPWRLFRPVERRIIVDLGASGGPVTVSSSLSGAWSVRNLSSSSLAGSSSVRAYAASGASGSWSVRNQAASTLVGAWSVLAAGSASSTLAGAWSVRNAASRALAGAWSVRSLAGATFTGSWSVLSAGSASAVLAGEWSVRNLSAASVGGAWSVSASAAATLPGGWQVRNSIAGPSLIGSWSVTALVASALPGAWSVDGTAPSINWAAPGARATVPQASVLALVPGADLEALIPAANVRAIVPFAGDDMDIIKTFDHQAGDTEIYELAYGQKYLDPLADTPTTLTAFSGGHAGIASQVAVGAAVGPVVKFAVNGTVPVGTYTVSAQLATTAGRRKTAAVQVKVEA